MVILDVETCFVLRKQRNKETSLRGIYLNDN